MKKWFTYLVILILALTVAIWFSAPFRQIVWPYLPNAIQHYLLQPQAADAAAGASGKKGGGPIAVAVVAAETASLPLIEHTYGVVKSPAVATVNARVASQITEIHVKDGQMVKAGDLLISLDDGLVNAQLSKDDAVLQKDQAVLDGAAVELDRAKGLAIKGAGTKQAYDQAIATHASAAAVVAADHATIAADQQQLAFTKITAPIDGRLGAIQAVVGNVVSTGNATTNNLMTITQLQPLKVSFQLPERALANVRASLQSGASLPVRVLQSGTSNELENGKLDFVDSAVDTLSGTINMSATVANTKLTLWPGQFVDVEVTKGLLANAVVVPTVAIQQSQNGSFVWVMKDDDTVALTPVTVAQSEGDRSAIASGLAAGDKVVVEGQLKLKDGAAVKLGGKAVDAAKAVDPQAVSTSATTDPAAPAGATKKNNKKKTP